MFFEKKKNQDNEFDFNSQNDLDFIEKETKIMSSHVIYCKHTSNGANCKKKQRDSECNGGKEGFQHQKYCSIFIKI